jgi:CDP-glucose 4,6-dehydratase
MSDAFWSGRSVLVTGASGLVGGWTVRALLARGARPVCVSRHGFDGSPFADDLSRTTYLHADVRDQARMREVLADRGVSTVVHLAAQAIVPLANRDPVGTLEANVAGTWSVLEACRTVGSVEQIVIASSDRAYGEQVVLPCTEESPILARHPYEISKACADLVGRGFAATYDLGVVISRTPNLYGGGDLNWSRIVPSTIRSVLEDERPLLRSNGKSLRDYFYVEDAAAALLLLAESVAADPDLRGEVFNFSNEMPVSVLQVVEEILESMGSSLEVDIRDEATHEIRDQALAATKARQRLGWNPLFERREGLERTIDWYRSAWAKG